MSDSKIILESLSPVCDIQAFVEENDASIFIFGCIREARVHI